MIEISSSFVETVESSVGREDFGFNNKFGLMLIGHDAINLDITEFIISYTLGRLKISSPSVELAGVIILASISREQTREIYPELEGKLFEAFVNAFEKEESVLVVFQQTDPMNKEYDFISEINKIKGKIKKHKPRGESTGWKDSIRGATPLPGDRARYEEVGKKIDEGNLSLEDYLKLTHHLVHSPDNAEEIAGLYLLIGEDYKKEIFGDNVENFDMWVQKIVTK
ncbi:hypothetical protein C4578_03070 [Candidatus Microgenomates bacterium]|jgi:hypothetical protein|nr:MAG: hypothetical protein C4578_03070 [Candidatus Microgenomates bacterium]